MASKLSKAVAKQAQHGYGVVRAANKSVYMRTSNSQVLTSWNDMIAANMPKASVENAYEAEFGTKPDEVHLNNEFCMNYGWLSYNNLGDLTYYNVEIRPRSNVESERILTNDTDDPYTHEVTLSTTVSNSATTTVTNASEISTSTTISVGSDALGIGADFTQAFSFSNEVGSSSTQETSVTISDTVTVTVPPHSRIRVYLQIEWESRVQDWDIPVEIDPRGLTGAQFPKPVGDGGHYHWGVTHRYFFDPPFESKIRGTLDASYNTKGEVIVEPATAL